MSTSRRRFLKQGLTAFGAAGVCGAFGNLNVLAAAVGHNSFPPGDYKALVCVFLHGGNDSFNSVLPYSATEYAAYRSSRRNLIGNGGIAFDQATIQSQSLSALAASGGLPGGLPSDGGSYGLHPAMAEFRQLFNSGHAAIVANVGTLLYPTSQAAYQAGTIAVPPQLFSHLDQSTFWQTSRPDDANANGWGGTEFGEINFLQFFNRGVKKVVFFELKTTIVARYTFWAAQLLCDVFQAARQGVDVAGNCGREFDVHRA